MISPFLTLRLRPQEAYAQGERKGMHGISPVHPDGNWAYTGWMGF